MKPYSIRSSRLVLRCGLTAACGLLAIVAAALPARGQCSPQQQAKLLASDAAAFDYFGTSVAVSGNTAVVGKPNDDAGGIDAGAAYVYVYNCSVWTQQAKLVPTFPAPAASDLFGTSVAISGDTVVVGAKDQDDNGIDAGAAYVFVRTGTVWTQDSRLTASDGAAGDHYGVSVAISGDTVVVGARDDDNVGGTDAGAAYVHIHTGGTWAQLTKLTASDGAANDLFGISVAVDGLTVVVGAYADNNAGAFLAGSAYVFVRSGAVFTQQTKLTAPDAAFSDFFGWSVAVSGDTAVIGAFYDDNAGGFDAGSAYVFVRSGTLWTPQAKLTASDAAALDYFGESVGLSGDTAVVGAFLNDNAGGVDAGSAYVFTRTGTAWTQQSKLVASFAAADDEFGYSVAISGDTAVVGAFNDDNPGGADAGSAYVFALRCDSDGDGVLNVDDVCPNNTLGLPVDCTGRPLRDCNHDCLYNAADIQCLVNEMLNQ